MLRVKLPFLVLNDSIYSQSNKAATSVKIKATKLNLMEALIQQIVYKWFTILE